MKIKKKVLFVVSDYLPNRSGGTLRVEKNIKYIREYIDCMVFTPELNNVGSYDVINGVKVFRTNQYNLSSLYIRIKNLSSFFPKNVRSKLSTQAEKKTVPMESGRLANKFFVPDIYMLWAFICFLRLADIIKRHKVDVIYSSGPAASNHMITLLAKFFLSRSVKWIAEFRDPWITNPFREPKIFPFEYLDCFVEKLVLKRADKIIVTSEKYKDDFIKNHNFLKDEKIIFIPNGFDSADFDFLKKTPKQDKTEYVILSAGHYYDKRTLMPFILAWEALQNQSAELHIPLRFIHYGSLDAQSDQYLKKNNIKNFTVTNSIPHIQCLKEMYLADWLLLIPGPGDGTIPGKTYEYLATGNPILTLVDGGPVRLLINKLGAGVTIGVNCVDEIEKFLKKISKDISHTTHRPPLADDIKTFDRKNIAMSVFWEIDSLS